MPHTMPSLHTDTSLQIEGKESWEYQSARPGPRLTQRTWSDRLCEKKERGRPGEQRQEAEDVSTISIIPAY